jgi:hypothetical protein
VTLTKEAYNVMVYDWTGNSSATLRNNKLKPYTMKRLHGSEDMWMDIKKMDSYIPLFSSAYLFLPCPDMVDRGIL